jgi:hypothetical protein
MAGGLIVVILIYAKSLSHFSLSTTMVAISRQGFAADRERSSRGNRDPELTATRTKSNRGNIVSQRRSLKGRARGSERRAQGEETARAVRHRRLRLEALENRALLATYNYPFGAMPDDTGEYMLGDVAVNVVLMESDPTMAPFDNLPSGRNAPAENWVATGTGIESIARAKANVEAGLKWWKDTLKQMFPLAPANILNFHVNYQYADAPVHTGYEPIDRVSDDFFRFDSSKPHNAGGWLYDFLYQVGFAATGDFSTDIRAYNDFTRQQANADWAFTIIVVNNANDADGNFADGGSFDKAFAFAGGRFMVVPASRPIASFAHEAGHEFWALDEYRVVDPDTGLPIPGTTEYLRRRGYYNTQNLNAADNPQVGFVQADSIMSNGASMSNSFANHTLDPYTMSHVGWQDGDNDGIFDVLDVPFSLGGTGQYNPTTGLYTFTGYSRVNTLANRNSSGLQNDITINQINVLEASIDDGPWQTIKSFPARSYEVNDFSVNIPIPAGLHTIRLRTADTRTGVKSNELFAETDTPLHSNGSISGLVFSDLNGNGAWESGEPALADVGLKVTNLNNTPINLHHLVEPDEATEGQVLNSVDGAVLSVLGGGSGTKDVTARRSNLAPLADKVFSSTFTIAGSPGNPPIVTSHEIWNSARRLRVDFDSNASTVKLTAIGGTPGGSSFGRLEAYDASNTLIARFTTRALGGGQSQTMTVSRPQGDIHHVIAFGHIATNVVLDTLEWGPGSSATSNSFGLYSLDGYPDGSYRVHVTPPLGYFASTPTGGSTSITVSGGRSSGSVNFGIAPNGLHRFHNVANPYNVNNDPANKVSPIDALTVINYLNSHIGAQGQISNLDSPQSVGYIDVNNDGACAPNDALAVINYLNSHPNGAGGEGEMAAASYLPIGFSFDDTAGEGETRVQVPSTPAEYYAQRPIHFLQIPGTDEPCACASCRSATTIVASQATGPSPGFASSKTFAVGDSIFLGDWAEPKSSFESGATASTSPIVARAPIAGFVGQRGGLAVANRKPAVELLTPLAPELEEALDDIAADVSGVAGLETDRFSGAG